MARTDDKLASLDEKIQQLKAQKQAIISRQKADEKKARTSRLIRNGEIVERILNCEGLEPVFLEIVLQKVIEQNGITELISLTKADCVGSDHEKAPTHSEGAF